MLALILQRPAAAAQRAAARFLSFLSFLFLLLLNLATLGVFIFCPPTTTTTGFILRHWLVVTKIAGCDILNFLVVVTDYADGFGSYINIYTAGKSGTALLLLRLAFLQNSLQGIAPLDV